LLEAGGAVLIGFADVEGMAELPRAVVLAMANSQEVLADPDDMPNRRYFQEYEDLNARLTESARRAADMLQAEGYRVALQPATVEEIDAATLAASFPHKTAATRAGLGWIGKSALLVTLELGPALRLASVLTDAPLVVGDPVIESRCGECMACVEACPAGAIKGETWYPGRPREEFFDAHACHNTCLERAGARGIDRTICGVCMAVCPRRPRS
jgi:epoxyqueuosine reductase QueG